MKTILIDDSDYPPLLRATHLPPRVLYYQGAAPSTGVCLAIVGSRVANEYGKRTVETLVPKFVEAGYTIVSGGALGIDTYAHQVTVDCGGKTVAVLGSGLNHWYPSGNKKLFESIIEKGGTILSPFEPTMGPRPFNFPARNRIISGLSRGCLVVQAAEKSGALITARFALDQGRDVFAVPGHIDDPLSAGCHKLIQDGAKLVRNAWDILIEHGIEIPHSIESCLPTAPSFSASRPVGEQPYERSIKALCNKPRTLDDLLNHTHLPEDQLHAELLTLMLAGVLEQNAAGLYVAI